MLHSRQNRYAVGPLRLLHNDYPGFANALVLVLILILRSLVLLRDKLPLDTCLSSFAVAWAVCKFVFGKIISLADACPIVPTHS